MNEKRITDNQNNTENNSTRSVRTHRIHIRDRSDEKKGHDNTDLYMKRTEENIAVEKSAQLCREKREKKNEDE